MEKLIRRIRDVIAAGTPIEEALDQLERSATAPAGAADRAADAQEEESAPPADPAAAIAERDAARAAAGAAIDRYRALRAETIGVPADLLTGATIEEIDASAGQARTLIAAIETRVRGEIAGIAVPPADPGRTPPDLSGLSPIEKIRAGLARQ